MLKIKIDNEIGDDHPETKEGRKLKDGRWTWEEHRKLLIALFLFGKNWTRMQKYITTRSTE